jgi:hypothetical protein
VPVIRQWLNWWQTPNQSILLLKRNKIRIRAAVTAMSIPSLALSGAMPLPFRGKYKGTNDRMITTTMVANTLKEQHIAMRGAHHDDDLKGQRNERVMINDYIFIPSHSHWHTTAVTTKTITHLC